MNNQLQNTIYFNQAIDNYIADWKKQTSQLVQVKAKMYAGKKQPKAKDDNLSRYLGFFKEKSKQCLVDIERILKVTPSIFGLKQLKDKRDDLVFKLEDKKAECNQKLNVLSPKQTSSESKIIKLQSIGLIILLLLLATAEGYLSFKPFYFLTGNKIGSLIISIVFAMIWALAAEKFAHFYMFGDGLKRKIRRFLLLSGFTIIFYAVAHLRVIERITTRAILNDEVLPNFWDINLTEVIIITAVGWLFFLGGVWLTEYVPRFKDIKLAVLEHFNKRKITTLKCELENIEKQIEAENEIVALEEYKVLSLLNIRKQAINEIHGHFKYLIEEFKDTNLTFRVDGIYPDCFNENIEFEIDTVLPNLKEDLENQ